jgi:hypothetical protein
MTDDTGDKREKLPDETTVRRREVLAAGAATGLAALAGCAGGGDAEPSAAESTAAVTDATEPAGESTETGGSSDGDGCTPGSSASDSVCQQVADDATVLTSFDASETVLLTTFDYPCGWRASTTDQFDDRAQANATRDDFEGYVDVQVRNYYAGVSKGFLDEKRDEGSYDDVSYEYDGETRTAIVSSASTAQYGTLAHAVVPQEDALVHVEFVSTMKVDSCDVDPRPDYDVVKAMVQTLAPNEESTFSMG